MTRRTVKLVLLDHDDHLLLLHSTDPVSGATAWYPVGGGIEEGESVDDAARREAYEETGLAHLPDGALVWTREHTYRFAGTKVDVHEDWLLVRVAHFEPRVAAPSEHEERSLTGFRWWRAEDLVATSETVFPPALGGLLASLLRTGPPSTPVDISDPSAP